MPDTLFLNVDVDVVSRRRLEPLVTALPPRVFVHYVGPEHGRFGAHFSLLSIAGVSTLDLLATRLARLIAALPAPARALWDSALSRTFNVGIQAGTHPACHEVVLRPATVALIAALRAQVVITTYAPETLDRLVPKGQHKRRVIRNDA